jgi:SNF2 family DNA or RNA helicase/predicted RNA methylase
VYAVELKPGGSVFDTSNARRVGRVVSAMFADDENGKLSPQLEGMIARAVEDADGDRNAAKERISDEMSPSSIKDESVFDEHELQAWLWDRFGYQIVTFGDRDTALLIDTVGLMDSSSSLVKGGPYIGPRGGKWADAAHTIPWRASQPRQKRYRNQAYFHTSRDEIFELYDQPFSITDSRSASSEYLRGAAGYRYAVIVPRDLKLADDSAVLAAAKRVDPDMPYGWAWEAVEQVPGLKDALLDAGYEGIEIDDVTPDNKAEHKTITVFDASSSGIRVLAGHEVDSEGNVVEKLDAEDIRDINRTGVKKGGRTLFEISKARRRPHPAQMALMFAAAAQAAQAVEKPPPGYQPVPHSKHGGYFRVVGGRRRYWYPTGKKPRVKRRHKIVPGKGNIYSPAFKAWFGDWEVGEGSAVVKKGGEPAEQWGEQPITVYHGTAIGGFTAFDPEKDKGANLYGKGFYFTADKLIAKSYTEKDSGTRLAATTGFKLRKPGGGFEEVTHLPANLTHLIFHDIMDNAAKHYEPTFRTHPFVRYDGNTLWAISAATGSDGRLDVQRFLSEWWRPSDMAAARAEVERLTNLVRTRVKDDGVEVPEVMEEASDPWQAHGMVSHIKTVAKWNDYGLVPVVPPSHLFEVYLSIKRPVDMDAEVTDSEIAALSSWWKSKKRASSSEERGRRDAEPSGLVYLPTLLAELDLPTEHTWDRAGPRLWLKLDRGSLSELKRAILATPLKEHLGEGLVRSLRRSKKTSLTWGDVYAMITDGFRKRDAQDLFRQWAESDGYDGIRHTGGWNIGHKEHEVWIAFKPGQIKSTDATEFDMSDPDIYKAKPIPGQMPLFIGPKGGRWGNAAHTIPYRESVSVVQPTPVPAVPDVPVRQTEGTRIRWQGISGWVQAWNHLSGRSLRDFGSAKGLAKEAHVRADLSEEISAETSVKTLRELLTLLRKIKDDYPRGLGSDSGRHAVAANQILVNNRLQELASKKRSHAERHAEWVAAGRPIRKSLGQRLLVKARRKAHPAQMGMFGLGVARPPGKGWQRIPRGKKGGYRKRQGNKWVYWYPETAKVQAKPHPEDVEVAAEPRLVVPGKRAGDRTEKVEESMAEKRTKGKRKADNELALEIVKRAAAEGRGLTDEEAIKVAGYTGKGGISGDLNQFYTRTDVAKAMWDVMAAYDDHLERVLEPSCGSGVFLTTAPKGSRVTGVELDSSAAAIAKALHGHKHDVEDKAFEQFNIERLGTPQNFDAVIANPPYVKRAGVKAIPMHKPEFTSADKYFIDTSLDNVRDGGLCTMLVHPGVMNNGSPAWQDFREHLLARAEVLDGFRLPNDTFAHTHCGIPADVIVLRKRENKLGQALVKLGDDRQKVMTELGVWDQGLIDGDYFENRPDRILGKALTREETGFRDTVEGDVAKAPDTMRRLTEAKLAAEKDPAARTVTFGALAEMAKTAKEGGDEAIQKAIDKGQAEIKKAEKPPAIGNTMTIAGRRYLYIGEPPMWQAMDTVDDVSQIIQDSGDEAIKQAHDLALDIQALMRARDEGEFYRARNMRRILSEKIHNWVTENGIPGSHRALGELSKSAPPLLDFMACVNSAGELSDLLSKDAAVTLHAKEVDRSDLFSVAEHAARLNRGYVSITDIQHNWEGWEDQSEDEIRKSLLASGDYCLDATAKDETGQPSIQHLEDYLTGDLYEKMDLERARLETLEGDERAQVQKQIGHIKARISGRWRSIDDVQIQFRVINWMGLDYMNEWLNTPEGRATALGLRPLKEKSPRAKLSYDQGVYTLNWIAPPGGFSKYTWEYDEEAGYSKRIETVVPEGQPVELPTIDKYLWLKYMNRLNLGKETAEKVVDIEEHVEASFADWLRNSDHREEVEERYNRTFNSEFGRDHSGDPLPLEGIREGIVPHDFQNQAVRWALETGRGILGQDVGLGKTFIAILLARMRKQEGTSRKPMVVVPKSVATNWQEEVETLFPGSKVLVIGEHRKKNRNAAKKARAEADELGLKGKAREKYIEENSWTTQSDSDIERNRKLAMVKQNEYDLIVCTNPAFERIPLKAATIEKYEEEDYWYERNSRIDEIKGRSKSTDTADKRIERMKADWGAAELARKFKHEESLVYWEDMDIDCLIADEAHAYKNLYGVRSRMGLTPKFLGGSGQSKRARKMQHMSRHVREAGETNGVYFLTATPTKNSPLEVFNMLQHIAPEAFRKMGIDNSEQFIDRFCQFERKMILTPPGRGKKERKGKEEDESQFKDEYEGAGNLQGELCVSGFRNLKELEVIMDKYMMIQTATDVGLKIPDANYKSHLVDMTDTQKRVYDVLQAQAAKINTQEDPGGMFRILDQMKKAAQDLELFDPEQYAGWGVNSPKFKACVDAAFKGAQERGGQIVFCDHNKSHERLKTMLMEKGLKEAEIGIINAKVAKDSEARQDIGNRFNRGEIKVVIGNTGTMGEGVNLQGKKHQHGTTDIHHLDQPWDPGTLHQRNGRGVRQGNRAEQVDVHTYLAKASFDGFRMSNLHGKQRWLDKLRSGADNISNDMEGQALDEVEMLAMASTDPEATMAEIREKRATAESAWYVKQAQESVNTFYKWQMKQARIRRMREGDAKDRLVADAERIKRQLIRNELLPLEIKEHLKSGDTAPVAVATYKHGGDETSRLAATIVRPNMAVETEGGRKYVITGVDLKERKVSYRRWGQTYESTGDIDQVVEVNWKPSTATPTDELKDILKEAAETKWKSPLEAVEGVSQDILRDNADLIDAAARAWYKEFGGTRDVVVKTSSGISVAPADDLDGKTIVYPWGEDKETLVQAVAAGNDSSTWFPYYNKILRAGNGRFWSAAFDEIEAEAEKRWKAAA